MSGTSWFSARCVLRFEANAPVYEERITLWLAADFDEAVGLAEAEAIEYSTVVGAKHLGIVQVYALADSPGNGAEIFSLMRDSDLEPGAYIDAFFDTGRERQSGSS